VAGVRWRAQDGNASRTRRRQVVPASEARRIRRQVAVECDSSRLVVVDRRPADCGEGGSRRRKRARGVEARSK